MPMKLGAFIRRTELHLLSSRNDLQDSILKIPTLNHKVGTGPPFRFLMGDLLYAM
jgi:hypothetical protein